MRSLPWVETHGYLPGPLRGRDAEKAKDGIAERELFYSPNNFANASTVVTGA
ncbi:hypothetical protein BH11VER1_BH11VER1_21130 [soil metagenome]